MIGEFEPMLEWPAGNSAMQVTFICCFLLLAGNGQ